MSDVDLKFECPECGCKFMEEVVVDATVVTTISFVNEEYGPIYHDQTNEGGEVLGYRCAECDSFLYKNGEVAKFDLEYSDDLVTTEEDLIEWMRTHNQGA